jgi:hypothetical protein
MPGLTTPNARCTTASGFLPRHLERSKGVCPESGTGRKRLEMIYQSIEVSFSCIIAHIIRYDLQLLAGVTDTACLGRF